MGRPVKWLFAALCASFFTLIFSAGVFASDEPGGKRASSPSERPASLSEEKPASLPADRPVSLEECISFALGGHPKIKGAEQDLKAGLYRTREAIAAFWPQVNFEANRSYNSTQNVIRIPGRAGTVRANYISNNIFFNTNWTLFDFGRTYFAVKSQASIEDSLTRDLTGAEQAVAYNVMDAYYALLKSQRLVKVAEETLDGAKGHLKQAQAFYEVGVKPKFDVTKAEVEVNDATVSLIQSQDAVKSARSNLNTRIGLGPLTPIAVQDRPQLEKLEKPLEAYLEEAVRNRPEIQSLEEKVRSSEYSVKAAYADYLPTLSASAVHRWYKEDHSDMLNNESLQLTVDLPVFEGFRRCAKLGETRAAVLSTKYRIEDLKKDVQQAVSQAFIDIEDARARFTALESSVKEAKENLDIARGRYEAGVGPLIEVTDAQVSLTKAETDLATAFYDYHLAFSRLLRSTGAGVK